MKALTVKQPWCWAITTGVKTVENRSRNTTYRGVVAIHAGMAWSRRGVADKRIVRLAARFGELASPDYPLVSSIAVLTGFGLPKGALVATAEITDSHPSAGCCEPWGDETYDGRPVWHWVLRNIKALDEPVPCRGALGLWTVPDDVVAAISGGVAVSPDGGE